MAKYCCLCGREGHFAKDCNWRANMTNQRLLDVLIVVENDWHYSTGQPLTDVLLAEKAGATREQLREEVLLRMM